MRTYTTAQGDMWDSIAYSQLGSSDYAGSIMALNQQYLDFYIFPAGIVLTLPDVQPARSSDTAPPWKQVVG